jgi:DedD protein
MDHELKQRLIGAVVVTALAAIFIPMLFDDPVDNSTKKIAEFNMPEASVQQADQSVNLPDNKAEVLGKHETDLKVSEFDENVGNVTATPEHPSEVGEVGDATLTDTGGDIGETLPNEKSPVASNAEASTVLDTGEVDESGKQDPTTQPVEASSKKQNISQDTLPAKKSIIEGSASEKPKAKTVTSFEKSKPVAETNKIESAKKDGKLVRWSLQAGSFTKKENAQAMVEKLRKQGMPATMVSKGNLYRIKIGPELDKKKAIAMKGKLASQKIQSYLQAE